MTDGEGAAELVNADVGGVSFSDVRFGYVPDREILQGLTFEARFWPGKPWVAVWMCVYDDDGGGGGLRCVSLQRLVVGVPHVLVYLV